MLSLLLMLLAQPLPPNHPPASGNAPPSADELVKKLDATAGLKDREKPFEIAASLGRLYFGQGRYADAQIFYKQALAQADAARTLSVAQRKAVSGKALPTPATVGCEPNADATLARVLEKAQGFVKARNPLHAAACLQAVVPSLIEVDLLYGHTLFVLGDADGAIAAYTRSLDSFDGAQDARYARAAATLDAKGDDLQALERARADFTRFLADAPTSPRAPNAKRLLARTEAAIKAGGLSKATFTAEEVAALAPTPPPEAPRKPGQAPVLTPEMMAAFQNAPRTAEMEDNFKKLIGDAEEHLAKGRFQDALDAYKQVMPYQPDNTRLRAGMAWTMIKLNRQPMADNVWRVASQTPDAIIELGDMLQAKGDPTQARAVWERLRDTVPAAASKLGDRL